MNIPEYLISFFSPFYGDDLIRFRNWKVDILSKLPKTEFNKKLAATKWSEILEGLNIAVEMIGPVPKLTTGDYGDLVQKIRRLGDHSHVQVSEYIVIHNHASYVCSRYGKLNIAYRTVRPT